VRSDNRRSEKQRIYVQQAPQQIDVA
jgi:hypothetical protein